MWIFLVNVKLEVVFGTDPGRELWEIYFQIRIKLFYFKDTAQKADR